MAEYVWTARKIAHKAHDGQFDKAGNPYIGHPGRVAAFVEGDVATAAAWLHDVLEDTDITVIDLAAVRDRGVKRATKDALAELRRPELDGFWIHLDCDVLDDAVMPAVDYRLPGGLSFDELTTVLRMAIETGGAVGLEVTIFNPALDADGSIARALVGCLTRALQPNASRTNGERTARR